MQASDLNSEKFKIYFSSNSDKNCQIKQTSKYIFKKVTKILKHKKIFTISLQIFSLNFIL